MYSLCLTSNTRSRFRQCMQLIPTSSGLPTGLWQLNVALYESLDPHPERNIDESMQYERISATTVAPFLQRCRKENFWGSNAVKIGFLRSLPPDPGEAHSAKNLKRRTSKSLPSSEDLN